MRIIPIEEALTQIEIAWELQMLAPNAELQNLLQEEDRILQALIRSLENKANET